MALSVFKATDFRCIERAELELDDSYNLVIGANASGKTSLLEALAYLGRGKSFRGASTAQMVRHEQRSFLLTGKVSGDGTRHSLGVRNGPEGLEIHVDGDAGLGAAALAEALPLQVIDPEVHELVGGGPDHRRRYLDWIAFHVEHQFIEAWRRFRRALRQRNAALKSGRNCGELAAWDGEFLAAAEVLDAQRKAAFERVSPYLEQTAGQLLQSEVGFAYRQGWREERSLAEALEDGRDRERQQGATLAGPHRAELALRYDSRQARKLVSRGQQKLLACSMVLAGTTLVQEVLNRRLLLLVDDPAAELDESSLGRLTDRIAAIGCQVVATSLEARDDLFPEAPRRFHVEHGAVQAL